MEDLICPNCGKSGWQVNSTKEVCLCMKCGKIFELSEVNVWYKNTQLESKNIEYDRYNF